MLTAKDRADLYDLAAAIRENPTAAIAQAEVAYAWNILCGPGGCERKFIAPVRARPIACPYCGRLLNPVLPQHQKRAKKLSSMINQHRVEPDLGDDDQSDHGTDGGDL